MFVPTTAIYTHGLGLNNNTAFLHNKQKMKNRKYHTVDITPEPNIKCNGIC